MLFNTALGSYIVGTITVGSNRDNYYVTQL